MKKQSKQNQRTNQDKPSYARLKNIKTTDNIGKAAAEEIQKIENIIACKRAQIEMRQAEIKRIKEEARKREKNK